MDKNIIDHQERMKGHYDRLSLKDKEDLKKDVQLLEKIIDSSEIEEMIKSRIGTYSDARVNESLIDGQKDIFDSCSDFYSVLKRDDGHIVMGVRVTPRDKLGMVPSELNLMGIEKLKELHYKNSMNLVSGHLKESTIDRLGRDRFSKLLKHYGKDVYEVGGFFGKCKNGDFSKLLLGLGQLGFMNDWKLAIQTQAPTHASYFLRRGFPYNVIADSSIDGGKKGYVDRMGRPAITLGLEGNKFGIGWKSFLKEIKSEPILSAVGFENRLY